MKSFDVYVNRVDSHPLADWTINYECMTSLDRRYTVSIRQSISLQRPIESQTYSALNAHSDMSYMHSMPLFKIHIVFKSNQSLYLQWQPMRARSSNSPQIFFSSSICKMKLKTEMKWNEMKKNTWNSTQFERNYCIFVKQIQFMLNIKRPIMIQFFSTGFFCIFLFIERIVLVNSWTITQLLYVTTHLMRCVFFLLLLSVRCRVCVVCLALVFTHIEW